MRETPCLDEAVRWNALLKPLSIAAVSLMLLGLRLAVPSATAQQPVPSACPETTKSFKDVPADHFAKTEIECLSALGIINGTSPTLFSPDKQITRAQTAALPSPNVAADGSGTPNPAPPR